MFKTPQILLLILILRQGYCLAVDSIRIKSFKDFKLRYEFADDTVFVAKSYLHCVAVCAQQPDCVSGSFTSENKQCRLPKLQYVISDTTP